MTEIKHTLAFILEIFRNFVHEITNCPNCVKQLVQVPLRKEGESMVCPFCKTIYENLVPRK